MKKLISICLIAILLSACHSSNKRLTGYNIKLWKGTPAWKLAKAVESNDTSEVNRILGKGQLSIDYREPTYGESLLCWAVLSNEIEMVRFLLSKGANPNLHDHFNGESPITLSCDYGVDIEILSLLLEYGGNPNDHATEQDSITYMLSDRTPLYCASGSSLEKTKMLIEAGGDVNMALVKGKTPLYQALIRNRFDVILYLLTECGVDPMKTFVVTMKGDNLQYLDLLNNARYLESEENESNMRRIRELVKSKMDNRLD